MHKQHIRTETTEVSQIYDLMYFDIELVKRPSLNKKNLNERVSMLRPNNLKRKVKILK